MPRPTNYLPVSHPPNRSREWSQCCGVSCPSGRELDTFDSDIVVDMSAHQSCLQICRGEGDLIVFRLEGGDLSDSSEVFYVTDVPHP